MSPLSTSVGLVGAASVALAVGVIPAGAGSTPGRETAGGAAVESTVAAGGGGRIAFIRRSGCTTTHEPWDCLTGLQVMDDDGGNVRSLAEGLVSSPDYEVYSPVLSPNGRQIAFGFDYVPDDDRDNLIYVVNADGSHVKSLASAAVGPQWSPDSRRIAYSEILIPDLVRVMRPDGSHNVWLADGRSPAWSPDGRRIAFSGYDGNSVRVMNANGRHVKRLARGYGPVWAPDGRRIAFVRWNRTSETSSIFVMHPDGSHVKRLARGSEPVWSPDGRHIAFDRWNRTSDTYSIFVVRRDGSQAKRLARGVDSGPVWSPDGRRIAFVRDSDDGASSSILVMDADGSNVHAVTPGRQGEYNYAPSWFGAAPTRTTLDARPEPVAKGTRLRVTGTVAKVGVALSKATVRITFKAKGTSRFTSVTTVTTDAKGRYCAKVKATKTGTWKATHPATAATLTSTATDKVRVRR